MLTLHNVINARTPIDPIYNKVYWGSLFFSFAGVSYDSGANYFTLLSRLSGNLGMAPG